MKKIMFNDRYGLTQAVLDGQKTMTRRIVPEGIVRMAQLEVNVHGGDIKERIKDHTPLCYHDEVAVAQSYEDCGWHPMTLQQAFIKKATIFPDLDLYQPLQGWIDLPLKYHKGWTNKMYVLAGLMPHQIRITNVKVERLRDISERDCRKEGLINTNWRQYLKESIDYFGPQRYKDHNVWTLPIFEESIQNAWAEQKPGEFIAIDARTAFIVLCAKLAHTHPAKLYLENPWVFAYEFELIK